MRRDGEGGGGGGGVVHVIEEDISELQPVCTAFGMPSRPLRLRPGQDQDQRLPRSRHDQILMVSPLTSSLHTKELGCRSKEPMEFSASRVNLQV